MVDHIPLTLAVAGAKGGVGKSLVCSNLAVQFAQANLKVVVMDLDLGAANQHTLFGLPRSQVGWTKWLSDSKKPLSAYLVSSQLENLSLIPASGFIPEVAHLSLEKKVRIIDEVKQLDADLILFDLGAGSHKEALDFFSLADLKVIVTTPEQTALMNNYEFIKNVLYRAISQLFNKHAFLNDQIEAFKQTPNMTLATLANKINEIDPWFAENLLAMCKSLDIFVVFNQIKKLDEAKQAFRLKRIAEHQLGIQIEYPGFVFYNEEVRASIEKMQPISLVSPESIPSKIFARIAKELMKKSIATPKKKGEITIAWEQLKKDFYKNRVEQKRAQSFFI